MISYISFIIYNTYIYITLFLTKTSISQNKFSFSVRTCNNTTSPNIRGWMHGPSPHLKFWGTVPPVSPRSPPMPVDWIQYRMWLQTVTFDNMRVCRYYRNCLTILYYVQQSLAL